METYHKIQTLFKRHQDGPNKGKMIKGAWTTPELEYLADNEWDFTEKVDGTNIRVGFNQGPPFRDEVVFAGRSDNAVIPEPLKRYLEETFIPDLFLENELPSLVLFGEGYGPKIQNGGNYRDDQSFVLFDVKIGPWWLNRDDVDDIANRLGIDSVPVIGHDTLHYAIEWVRAGLVSQWGDFEAEGLVCRPRVPMFDRKGQRIITKIKCVDFR